MRISRAVSVDFACTAYGGVVPKESANVGAPVEIIAIYPGAVCLANAIRGRTFNAPSAECLATPSPGF